jgi:hypothetical protein
MQDSDRGSERIDLQLLENDRVLAQGAVQRFVSGVSHGDASAGASETCSAMVAMDVLKQAARVICGLRRNGKTKALVRVSDAE